MNTLALQSPDHSLGFVEGSMPSKRRRLERCRAINMPIAATGFVTSKKMDGDGDDDDASSNYALRCILHDSNIKLSSSDISRLRRNNTEKLLKEKKLILVLDLDNTLLHTVDAARLTLEEEYMSECTADDDPDGGMYRWEGMVTKMRPHVRDFLEEASKMYDMYIYTMGIRAYALQMARLLDPDGVYFSSKIVSREDCTRPSQKGLDVVLGDERIAVVLDDKPSVWARHPGSLITIERYEYFGSSHGVYDVYGGASPDTPGQEIERPDGALKVKLRLLRSVHRRFFGSRISTDLCKRDVRQILRRFGACKDS